MTIPMMFPYVEDGATGVRDGWTVKACGFCRERMARADDKCLRHYQILASKPSGFYKCPYGFTSYPLDVRGNRVTITALVAAPRFGDSAETQRAKDFPATRVSRDAVVSAATYCVASANAVDVAEEEARRRLPQALHELRKLNAIVKQNAELLMDATPDSAELRNVSGAAELMSNMFEVLEALANLDTLGQIKLDQYIAVYDLAFKAKKIYQIRARERPIHIHVGGEMLVGIMGSKKTFPIVLTVLLENAIKYGRIDSTIDIEIKRDGSFCVLEVRNRTDVRIDSERCFLKGTRFAAGSEGSGLGLYLAREVVIAHNGSISCSVRDDLVVMSVRIPVAR